jgi:hypothetical protein
MRKRLLARQTELLEYLTSGAAIFGDNRAPARRPEGFDRRLLDLEARLSHDKRLAKIRPIFASTFEILGTGTDPLVREFADAYPPATIGVLENSRQFHRFLSARWRREPPTPGYLPDVASCELVMAEVRAAGRPPRDAAPKVDPQQWANCSIRRAAGVRLLRCGYAIRSIFELTLGTTVPEPQDTPLAIVMLSNIERPQIFELPAFVFELLAALDDFTNADALGASSELPRLLGELAVHELIEVRP